MKARRVAWAIFGGMLCSVACGGGDDGSGNEPAGGPPAELHPPPNIDASVCSSVATGEVGISVECSDCCSDHAYERSTEYEGLCICGNERDTTGKSACSEEAGSTELCTACCSAAGFNGHSWVGGTSEGGSCECFDKSDRQVCAAALQSSDPSNSCRVCCLNHGYLGMFYSAIGTPECNCVGG